MTLKLTKSTKDHSFIHSFVRCSFIHIKYKIGGNHFLFFMKLSMKTVQVHSIIETTLDRHEHWTGLRHQTGMFLLGNSSEVCRTF